MTPQCPGGEQFQIGCMLLYCSASTERDFIGKAVYNIMLQSKSKLHGTASTGKKSEEILITEQHMEVAHIDSQL